MRVTLAVLLSVLPLAPAPASAQSEDAVPEVAEPYDESVDTMAALDAALARARRADRPALLVFGANWCHWCRRLQHVLENDASVRAELRHFEVVKVRVDRDDPSYAELERRYTRRPLSSLPHLVVVPPDGSAPTIQETGRFEEGPRHVPQRLVRFLRSLR